MAGERPVTLSVVKADVGGLVGNISSHPEILDTAKERLYNAREKGRITDSHVLRCGDDIELLITHDKGPNSPEVHELAWNTLKACAEIAAEIKLYGAGEDLAARDFTGNLRDCGPGVAEMEFNERESEPVVVFMANKTTTGAWNLPLYKIFADPFNTSGLVTDPTLGSGFSFKVLDVERGAEISLSTPEESYQLLGLAGHASRFPITEVHRKSDGEVAAVSSSQRPTAVDGRTVGSSDPVAIVRCQAGFPAAGEVLEPFSFPHLVEGWMRAAHTGPLMPVPFYEANPTRFDGPPRVISAGFQITVGRLIGPHDMFDDPCFDETRKVANRVTDYMRRHGPFNPHRLSTGASRDVPGHVMEKMKAFFGQG